MRCDLHCPVPGGRGIVGLLLFLAFLAATVYGASHVLLDPTLNAAADAAFQVVVAVAAGCAVLTGLGVGVFLAVDRVQSRSARLEFAAHNAAIRARRVARKAIADQAPTTRFVESERVVELPEPAPVVEPAPVNLDALLQDRAG